MVKITFVRHGESVDNTKRVWGGLKDSNLTNHGMKQAEALALSFSTLPITAIYTSDLTRALLTAKAIQSAHKLPPLLPFQSTPTATIPLHTTELLREQYFGAAEGKPYNVKRNPELTMPQHFAKGIFPPIYNRNQRFPGGETKNEVQERAEVFFLEVVMPYVGAEEAELVAAQARGEDKVKKPSAHIVVVSHGMLLLELIVLLALKDKARMGEKEKEIRGSIKGMENTGWTRVEFGFEHPGKIADPTATEKSFEIKLLNVNVAPHLSNLKRQTGGISRLAYDPKQKDIRAFFSR